MAFHKLDMEQWERKTHYRAYTTFLPLNWNVTFRLDLSALLPEAKRRGLRFYPVMLHLAATVLNSIRAFRMAYDADGALGYYDELHPGYTVFHPEDETFSDIWSIYDPDFPEFYRTVVADMDEWRDARGYQTKPGRPPNVFPASMTPWLDFTSCSFDTFQQTRMLQPVLTFGKYTEKDGRLGMPVAVFASHAVADGWHAALFAERMQRRADEAAVWLSGVG